MIVICITIVQLTVPLKQCIKKLLQRCKEGEGRNHPMHMVHDQNLKESRK